MRNPIIAAVLSASLMACNPASTQSTLTNIIDSVQVAAVSACGFLPMAASIAAILTANASLPASAIAAAICQAVEQQSSKPGAAPRTLGASATTVVKVGDQTIHVTGVWVAQPH